MVGKSSLSRVSTSVGVSRGRCVYARLVLRVWPVVAAWSPIWPDGVEAFAE